MLIHYSKKCNGVIVRREDVNKETKLWTVDENLNNLDLIYEFRKEESIPNVQCIQCGKEWTTLELAEKNCYSFSRLAEKNLKIVFTSILVSIVILFLSSLYLSFESLKSIIFSVSFFIAFIILISKQVCEMMELDSAILKVCRKYEYLKK